MKYRQKQSGIWVVDYVDDTGKRRRESTGIKTAPARTAPAEVKGVGREIVLGIRTPKVAPNSAGRQAQKRDGRMTMSDLLDKCEGTVWHPDNVRSQRTIRSNVKILRDLIGSEAVEDMTFTRMEQLVKQMKDRGYKPATVKRKLAMIARALKMATMWTGDDGKPLLRYKPPLPQIVVNNLKERIISPVEQDALFTALEKRRQLEPGRQWFAFRVFLWLLFDTGGRLSESLGLGPKHITHTTVLDENGKEITISYVTFPRYRTKSGKPRTLPLSPRSVTALGTLMDHLVLDRETGEWRFFGFTTSTADVMFRQLREDVMRETGMSVGDITLHTIRHTVLTRLARGGMGLAQLQLWAGHSDPKVTAERYLHLIPSDLVAGLSILSGTGGTQDASHAQDHIKPVIVPNMTPDAIGANVGTPRLQ